MIVVSDTSPIRALYHLRLLPILQTLYGQVYAPPAVREELDSPSAQFERILLTDYDFIVVRVPHNIAQVEQLLQSLDLGESEALSLALELRADAVLIDEADGRKAAEENGVRPLGTLGVLLEAKGKGLVPQISGLIDSLVDELGFFVSDTLRVCPESFSNDCSRELGFTRRSGIETWERRATVRVGAA